jgi:hypothetical protein
VDVQLDSRGGGDVAEDPAPSAAQGSPESASGPSNLRAGRAVLDNYERPSAEAGPLVVARRQVAGAITCLTSAMYRPAARDASSGLAALLRASM